MDDRSHHPGRDGAPGARPLAGRGADPGAGALAVRAPGARVGALLLAGGAAAVSGERGRAAPVADTLSTSLSGPSRAALDPCRYRAVRRGPGPAVVVRVQAGRL